MSAEMANEIKLISGRSHPELSEKIAKRYVQTSPPLSPPRHRPNSIRTITLSNGDARNLRTVCLRASSPYAVTLSLLTDALFRRLGIDVARTISLNYSNQETSFTVGESVRDEDVFIIQSTATGNVNEGLMELL